MPSLPELGVSWDNSGPPSYTTLLYSCKSMWKSEGKQREPISSRAWECASWPVVSDLQNPRGKLWNILWCQALIGGQCPALDLTNIYPLGEIIYHTVFLLAWDTADMKNSCKSCLQCKKLLHYPWLRSDRTRVKSTRGHRHILVVMDFAIQNCSWALFQLLATIVVCLQLICTHIKS